jgi:hypothetical protein
MDTQTHPSKKGQCAQPMSPTIARRSFQCFRCLPTNVHPILESSTTLLSCNSRCRALVPGSMFRPPWLRYAEQADSKAASPEPRPRPGHWQSSHAMYNAGAWGIQNLTSINKSRPLIWMDVHVANTDEACVRYSSGDAPQGPRSVTSLEQPIRHCMTIL